MTRVVASLTQPTLEDMATTGRRALREGADLVEVRLDLLTGGDGLPEAVDYLAPLLGDRAIATLRPVWEGGNYDGPEDERRALLQRAADAGFFAVDVEAKADFTVDAERVILSRHDFDGTPDDATLHAWLADAHARGAWCAKVAVTSRGPADARALVAACERARHERIPYAAMAVNDPFLRLLAPCLGMRLAYAAAPDAQAAAPGQVRASDLGRVHADLPVPEPGTRSIFLFGDPVGHSLSPRFQNAALRAAGVDAVYLAARVPAARLGAAVDALRALDALGANVTVPHKVEVLDHVDALDPSAEAAGAANTLVQRDGHVTAHNTDGEGALRALQEHGAALEDARALVLGAGGAARAVAHALERAGARVEVANRTRKRAEALGFPVVDWADAPRRVEETTILVNCTTLGMDGSTTPVPARHLHADLTLLDAVYLRGGDTPLVRDALKAGARGAPGETMLLHQGALAFELWTGETAPLGVMRRGLAAR